MLKLTRLFYWLCVKSNLFLFVSLPFDLIKTFSNKLYFTPNATQLLQIVMVIPSIRLQLFSLLVYWTILNAFFFLNKGTSSSSWQSQLISVNVDEMATTTNNSDNMELTIKAKDEANR